jgi:SAM-dependent methyltransferase
LDQVDLPAKSFDVVTLHHVIEHAPDPIELLRHCRRVLKPSGLLVLVTPNLSSLGHTVFSRNWRDLDPPRHFYLFNVGTLSECVTRSGFGILWRRTSDRWAYHIGMISRALSSNGGTIAVPRIYDKVAGLVLQSTESILKVFRPYAGEELVLFARPAN